MTDARYDSRTGEGTAVVTVLGAETVKLPGQIRWRDRNTMQLEVPQPLSPGAAIRVDVDGGLLLGEVFASGQAAHGYLVSVSIAHVIPSVAGLANLMSAILGPAATQERSASAAASGSCAAGVISCARS